jgi:hypothetical protein
VFFDFLRSCFEALNTLEAGRWLFLDSVKNKFFISVVFFQGQSLGEILSLVNIINHSNFKKEFERRSFTGFRFIGNQVGNFLSRCFGLKPTLI